MTQQVLFNTTTGAIMQWQDTDALSYAPAPAGAAILPVTAAEWAAQDTAQHVSNGVLTAGEPPVIPPTLAQQAAAALNAGLAITSTGTPALDGTYAVNAQAQSNLQAVQTYILTNGKFPGSSGTYPWLDMEGAPHIFPSTTEFEAFATKVADYVADLTLIILTSSGTMPPATATIP